MRLPFDPIDISPVDPDLLAHEAELGSVRSVPRAVAPNLRPEEYVRTRDALPERQWLPSCFVIPVVCKVTSR